MARLPLQTNARAGTIALVDGYRTAGGVNLGQVYRARPKVLKTPSVYIESITEGAEGFTREENQRSVLVRLRVVWGQYDSGDSVDQRDRFVDGFYAYVADNGEDSFGANADAVRWVGVTDNPDWVPEWIPDAEPKYMTEITLGGFAST